MKNCTTSKLTFTIKKMLKKEDITYMSCICNVVNAANCKNYTSMFLTKKYLKVNKPAFKHLH